MASEQIRRQGDKHPGRGEDSGAPTPRERLTALIRETKHELTRLERKLKKQEEELGEAGRFVWYRQIADSLLADPSIAPRGTAKFELCNVHTQQTETVSLNPKFDARENAANLYKKARRGERGMQMSQAKVERTRSEVESCTQLLERSQRALDSLDQADNVELLVESLESQLTARGSEHSGAKPHGSPEPVPYRYFQIDSWDVYVGKNDQQNDEISVHFARPWDIWLHVAGHAGSHVLIRRPKKAEWPPREVIEKVASLAVWFSKARHTSYAEVHVTEGRFVRKRRHAPPGEVIAERCTSVRVSPIDPQEMFRG